ncbi:MAG TPA: type II toxin-antitoxin system RelE/ParE family toxin [Thermoanaerobaculia bacterium]|jgi:mRNA interferase RelE/StbE
MYRVVLAEPARRFYENAEASLQRKLDRCFDVLAQTPRRHPNVKPLTGKLKGYYRFRIGDYRVIYRVDDDGRLVIVALITHRSKAYD